MMFVVSFISRYMENPTELHLQATKRVLRYLKGTTRFGIFYRKEGDDELLTYTDSDHAGDLDDRKSTSSYVVLLSSGAISWLSKKQPMVSLIFHRGRIYRSFVCMPSNMVKRGVRKARSESRQTNYYSL